LDYKFNSFVTLLSCCFSFFEIVFPPNGKILSFDSLTDGQFRL